MARKDAGGWALVVGLAILIGGCSSSGPGSSAAQELCQQAVEARLKAPATADFSSWREATDPGSANGKTLFGTVDAENSFSAKIRMEFTCRLHSSGDTWVLETVSGLNG